MTSRPHKTTYEQFTGQLVDKVASELSKEKIGFDVRVVLTHSTQGGKDQRTFALQLSFGAVAASKTWLWTEAAGRMGDRWRKLRDDPKSEQLKLTPYGLEEIARAQVLQSFAAQAIDAFFKNVENALDKTPQAPCTHPGCTQTFPISARKALGGMCPAHRLEADAHTAQAAASMSFDEEEATA